MRFNNTLRNFKSYLFDSKIDYRDTFSNSMYSQRMSSHLLNSSKSDSNVPKFVSKNRQLSNVLFNDMSQRILFLNSKKDPMRKPPSKIKLNIPSLIKSFKEKKQKESIREFMKYPPIQTQHNMTKDLISNVKYPKSRFTVRSELEMIQQIM